MEEKFINNENAFKLGKELEKTDYGKYIIKRSLK